MNNADSFCFNVAADSNEKSLEKVTVIIHGENGVSGRTKHRHGKNAEHLHVKVGSLIYKMRREIVLSTNYFVYKKNTFYITAQYYNYLPKNFFWIN